MTPTEDSVEPAESGPQALPSPPEAPSVDPSAAAAAWVFGVAVAVAFPVIMFKLGNHFWFFRDDWFFITERQLTSADDLLRPHNGHWSTVPIVVFRALYGVFGLRSYVPYQAVVVTAHLTVVILGRMVMRRAGVRPWLATGVAVPLLLFGPGREDIIWAFQMGFTGSIMFGLLQLVLADHDGPIGRRDALALAAGLAGIATCSPAVPLMAATGLAILIKRGWRAAALQTVPAGLLYGAWMLVGHPDTSGPYGRPTVSVMVDWVRNGQASLFTGLGHHRVAAVLLPVLLAVGVILAMLPGSEATPAPGPDSPAGSGPHGWRALWSRLVAMAAPLCLFLGTVAFMLLSVQNRWYTGPQGARASRYLYLYAVLSVPLAAVAAEALARRVRVLGAVIPILLLAAVPANARLFDDRPWGPAYHASQEALITSSVRVPFARQVDPRARPNPDPYVPETLDMAFLLHAFDTGKLRPSHGPIAPDVMRELTARLSLIQSSPPGLPAACRWLDPTEHMDAPRGTRYVWDGRVRIRVRPVENDRPTAGWTEFDPTWGSLVTVGRDNVTFDWEPVTPGTDMRLCEASY